MVRSHGNKDILEILKNTFPGFTIQPEYHIGEKLKLDALIKDINVGIEFDGIQHEQRVPFFQEEEDDFKKQKLRDKRKEELCRINNIILVRIRYDDPLTREFLMLKILEAQERFMESSKDDTKPISITAKKRKYKWPTRKLPSGPFPTKKKQ